ncbi:hypothetical protein K523DRAFT_144423 [Schizophyllum commune Tattone D]|nr:hypothetical protein K523DRAFT_144423 [Schizophyllum commune Tattone D]
MIVTTRPMIIGHCVATNTTNYKTITTGVCCNIGCNKSLRLQLLYWPVGHCRAGRRRRRHRQNPAAAVHDALVVVAPPPAPRRTPTCCPPHPATLPTPPAASPDHPPPRAFPRSSRCPDGRACSSSPSHVLPRARRSKPRSRRLPKTRRKRIVGSCLLPAPLRARRPSSCTYPAIAGCAGSPVG